MRQTRHGRAADRRSRPRPWSLPKLPFAVTPHLVVVWLRRGLGLVVFGLVFYPYQFGDLYPFFVHMPFILLGLYWVFAPDLALGRDALIMAGFLVLAFMPPVLGYISMPVTMLRPFYAGYTGPATGLTDTMWAGAAVGMWLRLLSLGGLLPLAWSMGRRWGTVRGGALGALLVTAVAAVVVLSLHLVPLVFVDSSPPPGQLYWAGAEIPWTVTLVNAGREPLSVGGLVVERESILSLDLKDSWPAVRRVVALTSRLCLLEWSLPLVLEPGEKRQVSLLVVPLDGGDFRLTARAWASNHVSLPAGPFSFQVLAGTQAGR